MKKAQDKDWNEAYITDETLMPFGKHKGKPMIEVPASYLDWLRDEEWLEERHPGIAEYIKDNEDRIDIELMEEDGDQYYPIDNHYDEAGDPSNFGHS